MVNRSNLMAVLLLNHIKYQLNASKIELPMSYVIQVVSLMNDLQTQMSIYYLTLHQLFNLMKSLHAIKLD